MAKGEKGLSCLDVMRLTEKLIYTSNEFDQRVFTGAVQRIQTVNLQHLQLAATEEAFRRVLLAADFITADGWPVVALFRASGRRVDRVTGSDFVGRILTSVEARSLRWGLLGSSAEVGEMFEAITRTSGISLVYREHGLADHWDLQAIALELNQEAVDVLLVSISSPKCEYVGDSLKIAGFSGCIIGVGAAVEMAVGSRHRAPPIARKLGLEWVWRLLSEPRRLWRRYLVDGAGHALTVVLPLVVELLVTRRFSKKSERFSE